MEKSNSTPKFILIIKGIAQLIWALCILLTLVACLITGKWFFILPGLIASVMNAWALFEVFEIFWIQVRKK